MPTLSGVITDTNGVVLQNAKVQLMRWYGGMNQLPSDEDVTDGSGTYGVVCDTGMIQLTITPPEDRSDLTQIVDTFSFTKDSVFNYQFPVPELLKGQVLSHRGDSIVGITVALVQSGNQKEVQTDSDGWYQFALTPGTVTELRVRNMGNDIALVPSQMEFTADSDFAFSTTTTKHITLPVYHEISGKLYDADSAIVTTGTLASALWEWEMKQNPMDNTTTGEDGSFKLYVADGENVITLSPNEPSNFAEEEHTYAVTSDTAMNIYLTPSVTFTGTVLYWDSLPVSGITVALSNGQHQYENSTDMDGKFSFTLEPGAFPDFRIRSMGNHIDSIPNMMEYTVIDEGVDLSSSDSIVVVLPHFRQISGTVQNGLGEALSNITVHGSAWDNGMLNLPTDEQTTQGTGEFSLFLQEGMNRISLTNDGNKYADNFFYLQLDSSINKDITLAYQAKGISRVQPSVVSWGESGAVSLTGVNTHFENGIDSITLGDGVSITDITVVSDITITGTITVDSGITVGTRTAIVYGPTDTAVGAELFTVTAPVQQEFILDNSGKTVVDITISDGTGTDITVDSGTIIDLPDGVLDSMISFEAPILQNDTIDPSNKEFLQVQREFYPDGVTFDPPAKITFHYSDQDVIDVNEELLTTYKFDDEKGEIVGEYEVISRDTAQNIIVQKASGFSLYRLAAPKFSSPIVTPYIGVAATSLSSVLFQSGILTVNYSLSNESIGNSAEFFVYTLSGRVVAEVSQKVTKSGLATFQLHNSGLASGVYLFELKVGDTRITQSIINQ